MAVPPAELTDPRAWATREDPTPEDPPERIVRDGRVYERLSAGDDCYEHRPSYLSRLSCGVTDLAYRAVTNMGSFLGKMVGSGPKA